MARLRVQKEAFWLYGVIAGLAVREALLRFLDVPSGEWLEWFRLAVFLLILTQFYLGAAVYFEDVHHSTENELRYSRRSFGVDFVTGFFHTILFFWWSTTLGNREQHTGFAFGEFLLGAFLVHGFCVVWLLSAARFDTFSRVALWAIVNVGAMILGFAIFAVSWLVLKPTNPWREIAALLPLVVVNALQLGELFKGKPFFAAKLGKLIKAPKDPPTGDQLSLGSAGSASQPGPPTGQ